MTTAHECLSFSATTPGLTHTLFTHSKHTEAPELMRWIKICLLISADNSQLIIAASQQGVRKCVCVRLLQSFKVQDTEMTFLNGTYC